MAAGTVAASVVHCRRGGGGGGSGWWRAGESDGTRTAAAGVVMTGGRIPKVDVANQADLLQII